MAHEDRLGLEVGLRLLLLGDADEVGAPGEVDRFAFSGDGQFGFIPPSEYSNQGDVLEVTAAGGGFRAGQRELGGDVLGGEIAAASADATTFQQITGEEFCVGADTVGGDFLHLGREGDRQQQQG